jgi:hypothetical protein
LKPTPGLCSQNPQFRSWSHVSALHQTMSLPELRARSWNGDKKIRWLLHSDPKSSSHNNSNKMGISPNWNILGDNYRSLPSWGLELCYQSVPESSLFVTPFAYSKSLIPCLFPSKTFHNRECCCGPQQRIYFLKHWYA